MPIEFSVETTIHRAPEDVFDVATDPARLPDWQTRVVRAEPIDGTLPLRTGSRIREVRQVGRKQLEQVVEVVDYERPRRFGMRIVEGPFPVHGDLRLTPTADGRGTVVRLDAHGRARGALRLVEPLLARLGARETRRQYATLKGLLES